MRRFSLQGNYIDINGASIFYEDTGSGPPLILLHHGISTHVDWFPLITELVNHFHVFMPDLRGRGKSDNPLGRLDYRIVAEDIVDLCHTLSLDHPSLVGWGDSGKTILDLIIRYPTLGQSAIILGIDGQLAGENQEAHNLGMNAPGEVDFAYLEQSNPDLVQKLQEQHAHIYGPDYWRELLIQLSHLWLKPYIYQIEEIQKISSPVLLLHEAARSVNSEANAMEIYRLIPGAELLIFSGEETHPPEKKVLKFKTVLLDFLLKHVPTIY